MGKISENLSCVILAGGKNSRFNGQNKAFLKINGKAIIDIIIEKLDTLFKEIIIITNTPDDYNIYLKRIKIFTDLIKNTGPIGGIYTGLSQISNPAAFIVSCDMPFLNIDLIKQQISEFEENKYDIFIPRVNNSIEPLHAIYKRSILNKLDTHLQTCKGYSIRDFFPLINLGFFDLENNSINQKAFTNINTADDLKKLSEKEIL